MTDILDRIASGGTTSFVGGLADVAAKAKNDFLNQKQQIQENQFKSQQLGISKRRIDLDELKSARKQSQLRISNEFDKATIINSRVKNIAALNANTIKANIEESKLTGRDLDNAKKVIGLVGSNAKGLLDGYDSEIDRAAAYDVLLPSMRKIDPSIPDTYQGAEWLQERMSTASLTLDKFKQEDRDREELRQRNLKQAESVVNARDDLSPQMKQVIKGMGKDSLAGLGEELTSIKSSSERQKKELDFLNGIAQSSNMFLTMDELETHPGREAFLGASSKFPILPGSDAANFKVKFEQFRAQNFSENIKLLRGFGALSNMEGSKIEGLIANLQKEQSDSEFLKNLSKTRNSMKNSLLIKWKTDNPKIKNIGSVKALMDNPTRESENAFKNKFGRLPKGWFFVKETLFKDSASLRKRNNQIQGSTSTRFKPGDKIPMRQGPEKIMGFNGELLTLSEFDEQAKQQINARNGSRFVLKQAQ